MLSAPFLPTGISQTWAHPVLRTSVRVAQKSRKDFQNITQESL